MVALVALAALAALVAFVALGAGSVGSPAPTSIDSVARSAALAALADLPRDPLGVRVGAESGSGPSTSPSLDRSRPASAAFAPRFDLQVTDRLLAPRTGVRGVKIQPTPGTGLPPMSRPGSKSHGRSAWNSWNESLDRTSAPDFSAMRRMNPSPRPMAPAGGVIISPCSTA